MLFSLSLSPSSMTLMLQRIPASVCFYSTSRRYPFAITQAPKGVGRGKEHRCDRQEGDGLIRSKVVWGGSDNPNKAVLPQVRDDFHFMPKHRANSYS